MTSEKTGVPLLKGLSNYVIWAIKMKSYLIREGLDKTLDWEAPVGVSQVEKAKKAHSYIILYCKSEPTLYIQHIEYVRPAWEKL